MVFLASSVWANHCHSIVNAYFYSRIMECTSATTCNSNRKSMVNIFDAIYQIFTLKLFSLHHTHQEVDWKLVQKQITSQHMNNISRFLIVHYYIPLLFFFIIITIFNSIFLRFCADFVYFTISFFFISIGNDFSLFFCISITTTRKKKRNTMIGLNALFLLVCVCTLSSSYQLMVIICKFIQLI